MKQYIKTMEKKCSLKIHHDKKPEAFSTRIFAHMCKSNQQESLFQQNWDNLYVSKIYTYLVYVSYDKYHFYFSVLKVYSLTEVFNTETQINWS